MTGLALARRLAWGLVALVLLGTGAVMLVGDRRVADLGVPMIGGPFAMRDHKGARVTEKDLLGRPSAIFFGYTHCPEVCPTTMWELTQRLKELGPKADPLQVLFVSVDPARDTPETMATYLQSFDPRIRALIGTEEEVAAMARAWKVFYKKGPEEKGRYDYDHTASVYLMDESGRFVGTIGWGESEEGQRAKLRRLLRLGS